MIPHPQGRCVSHDLVNQHMGETRPAGADTSYAFGFPEILSGGETQRGRA